MITKKVTTLLLENGNVYKLDFLPTPEEIKQLRETDEKELASKYEYLGNENKVTINDLENGE